MAYKKTGLVLSLAFIVSLAGCAAVPKAPLLTPLEHGPKPKELMLKKVVAKPQRGARIGNLYGGLFHVWQNHLVWKGGRVAFDSSEYSEELRSQFEANAYTVVGDPEALFDDPSEWRAEYLIGALVKDVKLDLFYPWMGYGNFNTGSGSGYVEVNWQIYSRRSRTVVLKLTTKGSAHRVTITDLGPDEPLIQAFGAAALNLLAEERFVNLVAPLEEMAPEAVPPIAVDFVKLTPGDESAEILIDRARRSVLTIFAGGGHGSGFIVSRDGYVLTNQHVVGDANVFTAKTLTGRELMGEVVRINRERDVALLKLEKDLYEPLYIGRSDAVHPGSEIYAIGAPMKEELGQSVSKGIVSGYYTDDDLRFLQSDVAINPGNSGGPLLTVDGEVVGIAVATFRNAEGINFFIPIEDAVARLHIEDAASEK